jgi:hypothetical protein
MGGSAVLNSRAHPSSRVWQDGGILVARIAADSCRPSSVDTIVCYQLRRMGD